MFNSRSYLIGVTYIHRWSMIHWTTIHWTMIHPPITCSSRRLRGIFFTKKKLKNWFDKGIYLIQDLLDADVKVLSYTKFTEKYLLSCNFLTYFQVISAIPKKFIESVKVTFLEKTDFRSKNVFPLSSEISVNLLKMKAKYFYKLLMNKDKVQLKASTK